MSELLQRAKRKVLRKLVRMLNEADMAPAKPMSSGKPAEAAAVNAESPTSGVLQHADWKDFVRHDSMLTFFQLRGLECRTAFDVGAHRGTWSGWLRKRFPDARIFMFEAIEEQYAGLDEACQKLGNATLIRHGLSQEPESREITLWPSLSGSSVLPKPGQGFDHLKRRLIQLESIDSLVGQGKVPVPQIVKLDIQGHELAVLRGATTILGKTDVFVVESGLRRYFGEAHPLAHEIWDFMRAAGYELFDICGTYRRPVDHALEYFDMVFVRKDSPILKPGPLAGKHEFDW